MRSKIWFFLFLIQFLLLIVLFFTIISINSIPKVKNMDISEYIEYPYSPPNVISNAKSAKAIGTEIIDNMTGNHNSLISGVDIYYDSERKMWLIIRGYLFDAGGFVVISEETGEIINARLMKN